MVRNLAFKLFILFTIIVVNNSAFAKDISSITNSNWETLHLYHGENQRGDLMPLMTLMLNLSLVEDMSGLIYMDI